MTDERCERTDLITTQCAHCLGHADPVADTLASELPRRFAVDTERQPTTTAAHPGRCPQCGEHIEIGDPITGVAAPEQSGMSWVCAGCEP